MKRIDIKRRLQSRYPGNNLFENNGICCLFYKKFSNQMKCTQYFLSTRNRPDRAGIEMAWIECVIRHPEREIIQQDGRIRRWASIPAADGKYLRVVLLPDGETVHNAFFDRRFMG